jgi:hypothetical protein
MEIEKKYKDIEVTIKLNRADIEDLKTMETGMCRICRIIQHTPTMQKIMDSVRYL